MNLKEFIDPPKQYRPAPFWEWNGEMETAEVETQIRDMKKKGFGGFFIHAANGLKTSYMGDDWLKAVRRAVDIANELKIEAWLHDEDRGPSGYCGGKTSAENPGNLPISLSWTKDASSLEDRYKDKILAYTKQGDDGVIELFTEQPDALDGYGVFYERRISPGDPLYNGESYADLLNPDTVRTFIDTTHERYAKLFRYDFGKYMPGIYTETPNVNRSENIPGSDENVSFSFPWTSGFPEYFKSKHGYSPLDHLHHLLSSSDEGFRFRHDFRTAVNERFLESFTIPVSEWCREHEFLFTGHFSGAHKFHNMITSGGSVMSHYEYLDVPGTEIPGSAFTNSQALKQASSVANQLGKDRVIGSVFDSAGYELTFEDMKRNVDVLTALGCNFLSPRHTRYSLLGDRKYDNPPTISYHQPYWETFRVMSDYIARCSWAARQGRDTASVLVMAPFSSAYGSCDCTASDGGEQLQSIEQSYNNIIGELLAEHIAFDIGDERIISRYGSVSGDTLSVGNAEYTCVILPYALTWQSSMLDLLETFSGRVIFLGDIPARVDGAPSERITELTKKDHVITIPDTPSQAVEIISSEFGRKVSVTGEDGSESDAVLINHRIDAGAHIIFCSNTERNTEHVVTITVQALGGVVELDPSTGRAYRYNSEIKDGSTVIQTSLQPSGSRIFLIDQTQTSINNETVTSEEEILTVEGPFAFKRLQGNCLTIDRCTLTIDGRTILENAPLRKVKKAIWEKTGLDEYCGYQPWKLTEKNVRSRTNKTELTFNFTVEDIPENITLAMEMSDRFTVEINGTEIDFTPGKWQIDRRFRELNLTDRVVQGVNTIKATTDYLWDTEVDNIYIFGDFAVGQQSEGFPIIKEPETLREGDWGVQGYPFYSGSMTYTLEFSIDKDDAARYEIDLSGASGSVFTVKVNDTDIGALPFPPFRGDVTGALKNGENIVTIEVSGSLRNLLGPHHIKRGNEPEIIGPDQFMDEESWSDEFLFVPYGFIKPPKLIKFH